MAALPEELCLGRRSFLLTVRFQTLCPPRSPSIFLPGPLRRMCRWTRRSKSKSVNLRPPGIQPPWQSPRFLPRERPHVLRPPPARNCFILDERFVLRQRTEVLCQDSVGGGIRCSQRRPRQRFHVGLGLVRDLFGHGLAMRSIAERGGDVILGFP